MHAIIPSVLTTLVLSIPLSARAQTTYPLVTVYGGTGNRTVEKAIELGVDVLHPAVNWYDDHAYLKGITELCHRHGIKVIPSYAAAADGYGDKHHAFAAAHPQWWEKKRGGQLVNSGVHVGLSFGVPEVRRFKVETIAGRVRDYGLDGVALDYTRFFDRTCGYHESIVDAFKAETGRDPHAIPNEDPEWVGFRAGYITRFVRELRQAVDAVGAERGRPVELWACVGPDPEKCIAYSMQDWKAWVDEGLVDAVLSMIYERDSNNSIRQAMIANEACADKVPHVPMLAPYGGVLTSNEMVLDASLKMLKTGTGAVGYYRDDTIFDYGVWDAIGKVCQWKTDQIQRQKVNYLLNPGIEFEFEHWSIGDSDGVAIVENGVRSGRRALSLASGATVRQLIDRGFFSGRRSIQISLWANTMTWPAPGKLFLDVNTNHAKQGERYFRVPVKLASRHGWQRFKTQVSIEGSEELNWMILSLVADTPVPDARILVDDIAVHLIEAGSNPERFAITEQEAAANWQPADNVVRGQATMSSSFWEAGFDPHNAVDGDLASADAGRHAAWHSQRPPENQWLQIYLPAPRTIGRVRLLNASAQAAYRTRQYRVEVSPDGWHFAKVAAGTLPDDGTTWIEHRVPKTRTKYIRFVGINGYGPEHAVGLKEIEVFEPSSD